jgi:peptidylprolyl isomerase
VTKPGQTQLGAATPARNPKREAKRELARQSAARRAAARRRRQALIGGVAGVAALAVIVAVVLVLNHSKSTPAATGASAGASASANPALAAKPTVTKGTGDLTKLNVTTLIQGTGPAVQAGQTISVNYVGVSYKTGEEFDSSWKSGQPASFQIGTGKVIKGWDQGLVGVKVGSRVQLDIPADLAYGDNPTGGQPSGPLRFVVDVLSAT